MDTENIISKTKNILLVLAENTEANPALQHLVANFCGTVAHDLSALEGDFSQKRVYVCGDVGKLACHNTLLYVIRELSYYDENSPHANMQVVSLGQVPVTVCGVGVYFRCLFEETDYFQAIKTAHAFQDLTESTKPSQAFRKGIYLTEVSKELTIAQTEIWHYRLLRCSSNFSGATENFCDIDHFLVKNMNEVVKYVFEKETDLNHVLAQIYENTKDTDAGKEKKAKIKAHSDKTKDMPQEGLIAFCTFYDKAGFAHLKLSPTDRYDWQYKGISGLTKLHFKLKPTVQDDYLVKEFSVTLYPNSVFFIPLSTNRLYTHEIKPSVLPIDKIPTRMGYVVRCSNKEALHMNNQTYIKEGGTLIKLEPMTDAGMEDLKDTYRQENQSENEVKYGKIDFSMNLGDYQKPIY